MGLDMYLYRKTSVKNFGDNPDYKITITYKNQPSIINPTKIDEISEEIGYWRKANAIHNWFVKHVQSGEDDCNSYYVSKDHFKQLMECCQQVINNPEKAGEILPSASGFFFGSTEYDKWYFDSIKYTLEVCKEALSLLDKKEYSSFYYHSSW